MSKHTSIKSELTALKLEMWLADIRARFQGKSLYASVIYNIGADFNPGDVPWIRDVLGPWLAFAERGFKWQLRQDAPGPDCSCRVAPCEHYKALRFEVYL